MYCWNFQLRNRSIKLLADMELSILKQTMKLLICPTETNTDVLANMVDAIFAKFQHFCQTEKKTQRAIARLLTMQTAAEAPAMLIQTKWEGQMAHQHLLLKPRQAHWASSIKWPKELKAKDNKKAKKQPFWLLFWCYFCVFRLTFISLISIDLGSSRQ